MTGGRASSWEASVDSQPSVESTSFLHVRKRFDGRNPLAHQSQSLFILLFILSFSFYLKNIYISSLSLVTPKPKPQNQELFAPMASNSKKESTDEKSGKSSKP
ncbi:hypothetical protein V6N13_080430 [Hibiscus sabdariffa]